MVAPELGTSCATWLWTEDATGVWASLSSECLIALDFARLKILGSASGVPLHP